MARARTPTALKVLSGTDRPDRASPNEPQLQSGGLKPPEYLTDTQAELFYYLSSQVGEVMAVAARPDETALASLAIVTAAIADDNVLLADVGPYTKRENGDTVAHPATRRLAANLQRQQALMNEFGLTPASRSKVAALNPNTENPFANLDRI